MSYSVTGDDHARWEDNIKMDLTEVGWGHGLYQSGSGQAGCCECGDELLGSIKCGNYLSSLGHDGISGRTLLQGVS